MNIMFIGVHENKTAFGLWLSILKPLLLLVLPCLCAWRHPGPQIAALFQKGCSGVL